MGCIQSKKNNSQRENNYMDKQVRVEDSIECDRQIIQKEQKINSPRKSIHFVSLKTRQQIRSGSTVESLHQINKKDWDYQHKLYMRQKCELEQLCQKCQYYYQQHNIDKAYKYSQLAKQKWGKVQQRKLFTQIEIQLYSKLFKKVERQYQDVIAFNQEIQKGGWIQQSFKKGVKVSTRIDGHTVGTLVEGIIEIPFQHFISVLTEVDLYKEYTPYMQKSSMEKDIARNCKLGYSSNKFPFLTVRQSFFQGIGYNRLDTDGNLFLFTRSIQNRLDLHQEFQYKPKQDPDAVSLIYKYFVVKYYPISRGKGRVVMALNGDMQINLIPMFLLNVLAVDFGNTFFNQVLDISRKFKGSKWQKNVKKDPRLHDFFKQTIDQYLTQKGM